jgi:hypothetical protein
MHVRSQQLCSMCTQILQVRTHIQYCTTSKLRTHLGQYKSSCSVLCRGDTTPFESSQSIRTMGANSLGLQAVSWIERIPAYICTYIRALCAYFREYSTYTSGVAVFRRETEIHHWLEDVVYSETLLISCPLTDTLWSVGRLVPWYWLENIFYMKTIAD